MRPKVKQCPDCASWLPVEQAACRCGYRFDVAESGGNVVKRPQCDEAGCGAESICAVWDSGSLKNVCRKHYDDHFAELASRYCDEKGFKTIRDVVMHCRRMMAMRDIHGIKAR